MNRNALSAAALCTALAAAPALADHESVTGKRIPPRSDGVYDYAKVIGVKPVYRTVRVSEPRRECWDEPVTRYHDGGGYGQPRSAVPVILGGILGGVVGNQFGGGSGRVALTTGGALLGGAIGGDLARQHRHRSQPTYTDYETRCETRNVFHEEERIDGYRVDYKYGSATDHAPRPVCCKPWRWRCRLSRA